MWKFKPLLTTKGQHKSLRAPSPQTTKTTETLADLEWLGNLMIMTDKYKHSSKARKPKRGKPKIRPSRVQFDASATPGGRQKRRDSGTERGNEWIYGTHAVLAALANSERTCLRIVLSSTAGAGHENDIERACRNITGQPDPERLDREQIDALLPPGAVHQGLALLASPLEDAAIEDIFGKTEGKAEASVVVLDQATDPRNVGAVMRSAAAFGASAVIVQDRHAPPLTGALSKAASGAVEWVSLVRVVNLARAIASLKDAGFWAVGLDASAGRTIAQADLSGRVALVLGAEGPGLRRLTRDTCDELLKVPVAKGSDSLNLSNAAAVALYELNRQRG